MKDSVRVDEMLETIKRDQVSKAVREFRARFAYGTGDDDDTVMSRKLTADGCYARHDISREQMYLTPKENKMANMSLPNRVEREERRTLGAVSTLLKHGYRPLAHETLEEFVVRCKDFMNVGDTVRVL